MAAETKLTLRGVDIYFPFAPYDVQVRYMEAVIECLQTNRNGVLESPTGTGKTLCLLCAALAWQDSEIQKRNSRAASGPNSNSSINNNGAGAKSALDYPLIVFTSRTHAQLAQALRVMRRTAYSSKRAVVLGARDQLCVHPRVMNEPSTHAKRALCRALVHERACPFHNKLDALTRKSGLSDSASEAQLTTMLGNPSEKLADIEDLVTFGKRERICPYYLVATLRERADIVFAPYNYVLDAQVRRTNNIELRGAVLIIDEAHNVERICEDAASFDVSATDLATAIRDLRELGKQLLESTETRRGESQTQLGVYRDDGSFDESFDAAKADAKPDFSVDDVAMLKDCVHKLEEALDEIPLEAPSASTGASKWNSNNEKSRVYEGEYVFEWLSRAGIELRNAASISDALERIVTHFTNSSARGGRPIGSRGAGLSRLNDLIRLAFALNSGAAAVPNSSNSRSSSFLDDRSGSGRSGARTQVNALSVSAALKQLVRSADALPRGFDAQSVATLKNLARCYKVYVRDATNVPNRFNNGAGAGYQRAKRRAAGWDAESGAAAAEPEDEPQEDETRTGRILSFWCFSASRTMTDLRHEGIRSVVLTSGTLSPVQSFIEELEMESPIVLQNPHIVTDKQILCGVVKTGADGSVLNASYENRSTEQYQNSLGITILNFFRIVPYGVLVFFPSYTLMDSCIQFWKSRATWSQFESAKRVFVEPRRKNELAQVVAEYDAEADAERPAALGAAGGAANTRAGAALFGVCRGKVSEGVDFSDRKSRAVLVVGLPYPNATEPRVRLKMVYLDERRNQKQSSAVNKFRQQTTLLSGRDWYSQQAIRAVNQSCGRAIRHRFDYGVVLLLDTRFAYPDCRSQLSGWLRTRVREYEARFGAVVRDVRDFFREATSFDSYLQQKTANDQQNDDNERDGSNKLKADTRQTDSDAVGGRNLAFDFDPTWLVKPPRMPNFLANSKKSGNRGELFTFSSSHPVSSDKPRSSNSDEKGKSSRKSLLSALGNLEERAAGTTELDAQPQPSAAPVDNSLPSKQQNAAGVDNDERILQSLADKQKRLRLVTPRL